MSKAEDIIIDTLTRASVRVHWVFLANLILAGVVFSAVYSSTIAYDRSFLRSAPIFIMEAEEKIIALEKAHPGTIPFKRENRDPVLLAEVSKWSEEKRKEYGTLVVGQQIAINSMDEMKLNTAETPLIKYSIHPNSLAVFCGVIMIMLSMWIFFSTNQILYIVSNHKSREVIGHYLWAVRNIFMTIYARDPVVRIFVTVVVVFLPFASMLASTLVIGGYEPGVKSSTYKIFIEEAYQQLILTQWVITGLLLFFAIAILAAWYSVLQKLREEPS